MLKIKEATERALKANATSKKPKRYVKLYVAMNNREISQESMDRICYAIGSLHVEEGTVRADRVLPADPGKISKDADVETKKKWQKRADSYAHARDANIDDERWIKKIVANMGSSCELTEEEQRWVNYIQHGQKVLDLPGQTDIPF